VSGRVVQVNVSRGGVPKLPVEGAYVRRLGVDGDGHHEPEPIHGGPLQAVCIYSVEAIARVAADGHQAFPGAFGENLTLEGIEMDTLRPGDVLRVGEAGLVLEITKPDGPCQTIAHYFIERRIARILPQVNPADARWYASVLEEGPVAPGDTVVHVRTA
jgi:MOSC domain-containing protein YiiM